MIAYCAAVGTGPTGPFGWAGARHDGTNTIVVGGSSLDMLVNRMTGDFEKRRPFSIGMLAPPFPQVGGQVNELASVLVRLKLLAPDLRATLDVMASVETDATTILVWEAASHRAGNTTAVDLVENAASAAVTFLDDLRAGLISAANVIAPGKVSLTGTALLLSGLAMSLTAARQPTIVVSPVAHWAGPIEYV